MTPLLPMALRSLAALPTTVQPSTLPLTDAGTTYTMAQEAAFVDDTHYAVGRWDGTLSLFAFTDSPIQGPLIAKAVNSPAQEGIQAIVPLSPGVFASSNERRASCSGHLPRETGPISRWQPRCVTTPASGSRTAARR